MEARQIAAEEPLPLFAPLVPEDGHQAASQLEGGLDHLRSVVIDDELGLCDELEAMMAKHVETYECEWAATLADPQRLARFVSFVNTPEPDPQLVYVRERGQRRPALAGER